MLASGNGRIGLRRWMLMMCLLGGIATAAAEPLTQADVKHWLSTGIAVTKLQNRMKAQADRYDNVIQAFYQERAKLLRSRGYQPKQFDALNGRIFAALNALEEGGSLIDQQIAELRADDQLPAAQKREMLRELERMRDEAPPEMSGYREDWPAVGAWKQEIRQYSHWAAGNGGQPPEL